MKPLNTHYKFIKYEITNTLLNKINSVEIMLSTVCIVSMQGWPIIFDDYTFNTVCLYTLVEHLYIKFVFSLTLVIFVW